MELLRRLIIKKNLKIATNSPKSHLLALKEWEAKFNSGLIWGTTIDNPFISIDSCNV